VFDASLGQYTEQAVACMQAQRFFVEHSFKEQKQILGMDQFQTRKWLPWHHQTALNMMVGFSVCVQNTTSIVV
jgi:SRSO17 transposase